MAEVLGRSLWKLASFLPAQAQNVWKARQSCCMSDLNFSIPSVLSFGSSTLLPSFPSYISSLSILLFVQFRKEAQKMVNITDFTVVFLDDPRHPDTFQLTDDTRGMFCCKRCYFVELASTREDEVSE